MSDRLPENGASACRLPDTGALEPALVSVSPLNDEIYAGSSAVREIDGEQLFPGYTRMAEWLISTGRAKAVADGNCEMCGDFACYEYMGHLACDAWCLGGVLDEYGLAERVTAEAVTFAW